MALLNELWDGLSQPTREVLRWAWAVADLRAVGTSSGAEPVDGFDLMLGLLLAQPRDSDARVLFEHFGLTARNALPGDFPAIAPQALAEAVRAQPDDEVPSLEPDTEQVVERARELVPDGEESAALLAALLQASTPATTRLQTALTDAGADPSAFVEDYVRYVVDAADEAAKTEPDPEALRAWLQREHPHRPVDIPAYKADVAGPGQGTEDLLGLQAEVDAFAYLLASRGLAPPLAVGLFGDWGSGKSFFMRSVRRRVESLLSSPRVRQTPQRDLPLWKHVVQVEFNAWHYVEGDLWASLVDHIFRHLATVGSEPVSRIEQRQRQVLDKLESAARRKALAQHRRAALREDLAHKREELRQARRIRQERLAALERERQRAFRQHLVGEELAALGELAPSLADPGQRSAVELLAALDEARGQIQRAQGLLGPFWSSWRRVGVAFLAALGIPAGVFVLERLGGSGVLQLAGGAAAGIAYVAGLLRTGVAWTRERLDTIERARHQVERAAQASAQAVDDDVRAAEQELELAEEQLQAVLREEESLETEIHRLDAELASITPSRMLSEFVSERAGAQDYRRHLGLAALIRQDFEQLSDLIRHNNDQIVQRGETDELAFNRIVLYIDDLDRCPEEHVVKVLQAVHLLLAFDLFVVVVAVDSRWLANSLVSQHPGLLGGADPGRATPQDYLEKIFQLPFWVQPLDDPDLRKRLVHGLLEPNLLRAREGQQRAGTTSTLEVDDAHREVLTAMLDTGGGQPLTAQTLAITRDELDFLDTLAPLLGDTPRGVKRFVNVYQLLTTMSAARRDDAAQPPEAHLLAFLAAVNHGAPGLAEQLFALALDQPATPLGPLVAALTVPPEDELTDAQRQRLDTWIAERPQWQTLPAERLKRHIPLVQRLTFQPRTAAPG